MDLKKFLPGQEKENIEHYWALVIEPGWIQAGIWRIDELKAEVVTTSPPSAWDLDEDLVTAVDTALSGTIQGFPEDLKEPSKTVFGVVSSWVKDGEIDEEYLQKIKRICTDLSLSPVGFVILPEAISHLYKSEEGSPLSAIALGVYKENMEISLFKNGELVGNTSVARSVSIIDDVTEGMARFKDMTATPSRFVLYDGREGELEEVRQSLLKVNWDDFDDIKFLHTPKIELVDSVRKVYAVCLAGGSELASVTAVESVDESRSIDEEDDLEKEPQKKVTAHPESVGFVVGKDIAKEDVDEEKIIKREDGIKVPEKEELDNLGPVKSGDADKKRKIKFALPGKAWISQIASKLRGRFKSPLALGKKFAKIKVASGGKRVFLFGIAFLAAVVIGGFAFWWYVPKATVTIFVSPRSLDERVKVKIDPSASSSDVGNKILPGKVVDTNVSGEKTKSTTGTKTVGESAKGEVVIYRVGVELTLSAGTVLLGPKDLRFALDETVTIASGSAGSPGQTKAFVTAQDIGAQYNLAASSTFKVDNYSTSDMEAKNEVSFSGGSSREINAVAQEDADDLLDELTEELKGRALDDLRNSLDPGEVLVDESVKATTVSEDFSDEVGDEASTLKLSIELGIEVIVVNKGELADISREVLKDRIPEGFVLREEQIDMDFEYEDEENGIYAFNVSMDANLLPAVDPNDVSKKLVGKYPQLAEDYLTREIPGFVRAQVKMKPTFPGRLNTLPRLAKNIDVEISAEK